jgi:hypothetical protein
MDLLIEIKRFYDILVENKLKDAVSLDVIEAAAEEVFDGKWKVLTKEIKIVYNNEIVTALNAQLDKIKEIVANEKNN